MVKVVFLHPDLGIGGAERLVVDAGLALQRRSHDVTFFTAHHDEHHCFPETVDGTLSVKCYGDWLPRSVFGYLMALCAYIRMIYLALCVRWILNVEFDVAIVDQVSACVPFLKGRKKGKVLFYCHYPDQLLTQRKSFLKSLYRFFLDWLEESTTKCADCVLVNSEFTAGVFRETFTSISTRPDVLYPSLDFSKFDACSDIPLSELGLDGNFEVLFVSVNRFERKKNLPLALLALDHYLNGEGKEYRGKVHLIMAGGYDPQNRENIDHFQELSTLRSRLDLEECVTFMKSPDEACKVNLLRNASSLIYTPDCEHFGIVPIEAMYCKTPVIAVDSGGPKETVVDGTTGFLCPQTPSEFAEAMGKFVKNRDLEKVMGQAGYARVQQRFSFDSFSDNLDSIIGNLVENKQT